MSVVSAKLLGVATALAVIGGMQFEIASGQVLTPELRNNDATNTATHSVVRYDVNRSAKSDRQVLVANPGGEMTAVSNNLSKPAMTVAIRVKSPAKQPQPANVPAQKKKQHVACEGVVSVLTEVAKQLQPGRCVT